eukprot:1154062-Pelagomonas_calceolata.AAC.5
MPAGTSSARQLNGLGGWTFHFSALCAACDCGCFTAGLFASCIAVDFYAICHADGLLLRRPCLLSGWSPCSRVIRLGLPWMLSCKNMKQRLEYYGMLLRCKSIACASSPLFPEQSSSFFLGLSWVPAWAHFTRPAVCRKLKVLPVPLCQAYVAACACYFPSSHYSLTGLPLMVGVIKKALGRYEGIIRQLTQDPDMARRYLAWF